MKRVEILRSRITVTDGKDGAGTSGSLLEIQERDGVTEMTKLGIGTYQARFLHDWDYCLSHFEVLELQDFIMPGNLENPDLIAAYRGMLDGYPGEVTVHGPYLNLVPTSIDSKVQEVAELRYLQGIDAAVKLGAAKIVIHSWYDLNSGYAGYDQLWLEQNTKFWSGFLEKIRGSGVQVLLENCYDQHPATFAGLISALNTPQFGSCLDFGHCHCLSRFAPEEWLSQVQGFYFHITDNNGSRDSHLIPGQGSIDFGTVAGILAGLPEVYLVGEAGGDFRAQYRALLRLKNLMNDLTFTMG